VLPGNDGVIYVVTAAGDLLWCPTMDGRTGASIFGIVVVRQRASVNASVSRDSVRDGGPHMVNAR
jgi:hypothetical protein